MKLDVCGMFLLVLVLYFRSGIIRSDERVKEACQKISAVTLHPHPSNCQMYVQCVGHIAYERQCGNDLFFDPSTRVCDYQPNVKCEGNACNKNNGHCQHNCLYLNDNSYRCTCRSGYQLNNNHNQRDCIQGSINMETYCKHKHAHQLPDPRRCNGFVKCQGDKSISFSCGHLVYNEEIKSCDHAWNWLCKGRDFGAWSSWSLCSKSNMNGACMQERSRVCTSGGTLCEGWKSEIRSCGKEMCIKASPCNLQNGGCMEKCKDEGGVAICSCGEGRTLSNDKKSCTSEVCGVAPLRDDTISLFIISGQDVMKGRYPWQVAIYIIDKNDAGEEENMLLCGGSLIGRRQVLSAAHCFPTPESRKNVQNYKVVLGDNDRSLKEGTEQILDVIKIYVNEYYDGDTGGNDIAILTLSGDANFSDFIYPICLPKLNEELLPGTSCRVTGWGNIYHASNTSDILQEITVPVIEDAVCKTRNNRNRGKRKVTSNMVCTGFDDGSTFKSACHSDSGGPLSCMMDGLWKLYGVVSWGDPQCNALGSYNVFTKVSKYIGWINKSIV